MSKKLCGTKAKHTQQSCKLPGLPNGQCRFHGGKSTGPKTPEGKVKALLKLRQFRKAA